MNEQLNSPAIHGEAVAGRSAQVRKQLLRMVSNMAISTFDMIELLAEAQEQQYPLQWGFSSLPDYGAKELGLKPRKTQYLTRIGKVTKQVGLKREQYEPAGTTKLREITTLDPEGSFFNIAEHKNEDLAEHIVRLILDHDSMTVDQVKEEVLRLKGRTGPDRPVLRTTSYTKSVWENVVKPARELARQILGSAGRDDEGNAKEYSDGACDEVIYAAFLADPNNAPEPLELPREEKDMQDYIDAELPMEKI
jgi:hypothetical protein